jgi:hypothetical protein
MLVAPELTLLYLFGIIFGCLSLAIDQIVIRYLSPELFGLAAQLELCFASILYFSREWIRTASMYSMTADIRMTVEGPRGKKSPQGVINLAYVSVALGISMSVVSLVYLLTIVTVQLPFFRAAAVLYTVAAMVEVVSEPAVLAAQQFMMFDITMQAPRIASFMQYTAICGIAVMAYLTRWDVGLFLIATGKLCYSVVIASSFLLQLGFISMSNSSPPFSLLLTKVDE